MKIHQLTNEVYLLSLNAMKLDTSTKEGHNCLLAVLSAIGHLSCDIDRTLEGIPTDYDNFASDCLKWLLEVIKRQHS